jgi:hypothetical protein
MQRRFLKPQIVAMSQKYGYIRLPVEIIHGAKDILVPRSFIMFHWQMTLRVRI